MRAYKVDGRYHVLDSPAERNTAQVWAASRRLVNTKYSVTKTVMDTWTPANTDPLKLIWNSFFFLSDPF